MMTPRPPMTPARRHHCLASLALVGSLLASARPAAALPDLVLLLRHGHKSGEAGNFNLSSQGFERAIALATLLPRC